MFYFIPRLQVAIGEPSKAKRYSMKSGAIEEFKMHIEKQFPTEKKAIAKFVDLMTVSLSSLMITLNNVNSPIKYTEILTAVKWQFSDEKRL